MHKINIVSSQAVLEMSSISMDTLSMSSSPLVNSLARHWWVAISIHPNYGFVCGRHDAAWQPRSHNPQDWHLGCLEATGWVQKSLAFLDDAVAVQLLHVCGAVCRCTILLEQYDIIMTSRSSIEEVSKRYHQNFLLCNNNEITACIADLFNSFFRSVCGCIFQGSAATNYMYR